MDPSRLLVVALLLVAQLTSANSASSASCFLKSNDVTQQDSRSPCGSPSTSSGFLSCCSSGDECLPDGLCLTKENVTSQAAGYYIGGCTDPSLQDPSCNPSCGDASWNSVAYNYTSNEWQCCGATNGIVNCSSPTDQSFSAPAPFALQATYTIGMATANNASPPSSISSSSSGGLSAGAKAGIAVACIIAGLMIFGTIALVFLHRRRQRMLAIATAKNDELEEQEQEKQRKRQQERQRQWHQERMESVISDSSPPSYRPPTSSSSDPNSPRFLPVFDPNTGRPVEKPIGRLELQGSASARAELPAGDCRSEMPGDETYYT